jgi:hypothetical protein
VRCLQELKKREMEELNSVLGQLGINADEIAKEKENECSAAAAKRKKKKEKKQQQISAAEHESGSQAAPAEPAPAEAEPSTLESANGSSEPVRTSSSSAPINDIYTSLM